MQGRQEAPELARRHVERSALRHHAFSLTIGADNLDFIGVGHHELLSQLRDPALAKTTSLGQDGGKCTLAQLLFRVAGEMAKCQI